MRESRQTHRNMTGKQATTPGEEEDFTGKDTETRPGHEKGPNNKQHNLN